MVMKYAALLLMSLVARRTHALAGNSWQKRLDRALLDVDATPQGRARNLQKALNDPAIRSDVLGAFGALRQKGLKDGHPDFIDTLWPKGTLARADLEGLQALRKQAPEIAEGLRGQRLRPPMQEVEGSRGGGGGGGLPDLAPVASALVGLVTDKSKRRELQNEAKNVLRTSPRGLETPRYTLVGRVDAADGAAGAVELRQYAPFTVATRAMDGGADGESLLSTASGSAGFTSLAGYLFGDNARDAPMKMTMPVEIRGGYRAR